MAQRLDSALTARLREVLSSDSVTESELRELTDQAGGWLRALEAQVQARERKLTELTVEPGTGIGDLADQLRRVEALRPELDEVRGLVSALDDRARELRAAWLRAASNS